MMEISKTYLLVISLVDMICYLQVKATESVVVISLTVNVTANTLS